MNGRLMRMGYDYPWVINNGVNMETNEFANLVRQAEGYRQRDVIRLVTSMEQIFHRIISGTYIDIRNHCTRHVQEIEMKRETARRQPLTFSGRREAANLRKDVKEREERLREYLANLGVTLVTGMTADAVLGAIHRFMLQSMHQEVYQLRENVRELASMVKELQP